MFIFFHKMVIFYGVSTKNLTFYSFLRLILRCQKKQPYVFTLRRHQ